MKTGISLKALRELSPVFRKLESEVREVKDDERRYKDKPGYVPPRNQGGTK
jgi:hypothetical protein